MTWLLAPLGYEFMQRALIGVVCVGVLCAVVGSFIILRDLAFIGEGLAHGSLAGLAGGYLLRQDLYLTGSVFAVGLALLIGFVRERAGVGFSTAIGILFSASAATGILLISLSRWPAQDVTSYLFGNVLAISPADLRTVVLVTAAVLALVLGLLKELVALSFDRELAATAGVPTTALQYLLLVLTALTVVVTLQTVGVILVTAMLVIPAAAAYQIARRVPAMLALAALFGVASGVVGLYLSFYWRLASGASIVLTAVALFALCLLLSPRRRGLPPRG